MIDFFSIQSYKDEQLRDYQLANKLKIYEQFKVHQSVMLQMPTGTGKTRLFASIVKDIHNISIKEKKAYRVLILAHRNELIKQISENIGVQYGIAHGKIMSKNWEEDYFPTQVASVQTLIRRLEKWGEKKFDFIIIDEAHHALAPTYVKICNEFPDAKILGVTATPYRMSKLSFRSMFDELIISESIGEFIKKGYLSEYEYYSIKQSSKIQNLVDNINEFDFDGDYSENALSNTFDKDKIRANLLDTYFKYADGKKGIIYTINKRHNEHVCSMFIDAGIIAKAIDSDTNHEERNSIVKDFKNGNIQILCNVNIFSEGFDCPDVEFIQLARPTKSLSMYLQQVGRGFRIHEEKDKVIFLDNVGLFNRFGLPSANRKWLSHFNGLKDSEEFSQDNNSNNKVKFIEIDIEEGNEKIELIFNSKNPEEVLNNTKTEFDSIEDFDLFVYKDENIDQNNLSFSPHDEFFLQLLCSYDESLYDSMYESLLGEYDQYNKLDSPIKRHSQFKKIKLNNKFGLFNEIGSKVILKPIYDDIIFHSIYGQILIKTNGKFGVFNPFTEDMEIPPIYDDIEKINNLPNHHIIKLNNEFGIVSKINNLIIEPFSDWIIPFSVFFNVNEENEWLVYDLHLNKIDGENFEVIEDFQEYNIVRYENIFGFKYNENLIYPFLISSYEIVFEKIIIVDFHNSGLCVLDGNLDTIIETDSYSEIEVIGNSFFRVKRKGKFGVYNFNGDKLLSEDFFQCEIKNNNFIVYDGSLWKSFDLSGKELRTSYKKRNVVKNNENKYENTYENTYENKISKMYEECRSNFNNDDKIIRVNKIKNELQITNSEIATFFKTIGLPFSNNPNAKLTESEYIFIKTMKERK